MSSEIKKLRTPMALLNSILDRSIDYYPRKNDAQGYEKTVKASALIEQLAIPLKELNSVNMNREELDDVAKLARESLNEVKALTDYQDGKATRLLTIITFLSAFSGILFGKFVDSYPLHSMAFSGQYALVKQFLVYGTYISFCAFIFLAACGALTTFVAIRTTFKFPSNADDVKERSYLFYQSIVQTDIASWSNSFLSEDKTAFRKDLKLQYVKNYIVETYLVASKLADKLRYLQPAQKMQFWAIRALMAWIVLFSLCFVLTPPLKSDSVKGATMAANVRYSATGAASANESAHTEE